MILDQHSEVSPTPMYTLAIPAARTVHPTKAVEIVRAESELLAIDQLMADLTAEFVADARR